MTYDKQKVTIDLDEYFELQNAVKENEKENEKDQWKNVAKKIIAIVLNTRGYDGSFFCAEIVHALKSHGIIVSLYESAIPTPDHPEGILITLTDKK